MILELVDHVAVAAIDRRPLMVEAGEDTASLSSSGVAVAEGSVFASVGSQVIAYALAPSSG